MYVYLSGGLLTI